MKRLLALMLTFLLVLSTGITEVMAVDGYTCTVNYFLMNKDMSTYFLDKTETSTVEANTTFSPTVYDYEGFISPTQKTVTVDKNRTVNYFYERETYTIKYVTAESEDTLENQEKIFGIDTKISKIIPERKGYTFAGWSNSADSNEITYRAGDIFSEETDITIYALWNINAYIVSFDSNGGTLCDAVAYEYNSEYGELPTPTKAGYNFSGWYFDSNLTDEVDSKDIVDATGDRILYAKWTERKINSLAIASLPVKTEYFTGDTINTTGLTLTASYDNGETEVIRSGFEVDSNSFDKSGTYEVTVSYEGLSCNYNIEVLDVKLVSLIVKQPPEKLIYYVDDNLDTTEMVVEVTYNNGKTKLITQDYTAEYDFSVAGESTVTISYTEYDVKVSDSFNVTVVECPEIYSDNLTAENGQIVAVPVYIKNNSGLMGYHIKLEYDNEAFTPVSTKASEPFNSGFYNDSIGASDSSILSVVWTGTDVVVGDGVLFTAYFRAEDVKSGDYEITISYEESDTITDNYDEVKLACTSFDLTIINDSFAVIPKLYSENINAEKSFELPVFIKDAEELNRISLVISYDEGLMTPQAVATQYGDADFVYDSSTVLVNIENMQIESDLLLVTIAFELSDTANGKYKITVSSDCAISTEVELNAVNEVQSKGATIYADEYIAGEHLITVPISISGNSGIMGYKINANFDSTVLSLTSVFCGDDYLSGMFTYSEIDGSILLVWNNTENISKDGVLFTLSFERLESEESSTVIELSYVQEDTFDEAWNDVLLECESINIYTAIKISGDVNSDGVPNLKDLIILRRYLAGGYDVSINERNADINNDEKINIIDLMLLERYLDGSFDDAKQWFE